MGNGIQWTGIPLDCADEAEPMARFYEGLLGFEIRSLGPRWAQLFDPDGGVRINIAAMPWYQPPTSPETPGELTKMLRFEVQVHPVRGHEQPLPKGARDRSSQWVKQQSRPLRAVDRCSLSRF